MARDQTQPGSFSRERKEPWNEEEEFVSVRGTWNQDEFVQGWKQATSTEMYQDHLIIELANI